jgi:hypothetical protein
MEIKLMAQIRYPVFFMVLALIALITATTAQARGRQGFPTPPPLDENRPVVYVTSQGLFYDSIVVATLPPEGPFQKLEMTPDGLQTEFGPGDPNYLGGRWWVDANGDNMMDGGDMYFMCPLLAPGYTM